MKRSTLLLAVCALAVVYAFQAAETTNDKDVVQGGGKLQWSDYKGKVDTSKKTDAYSYVLFSYNHQITGDSVRVVMKNTFFRKYSWAKESAKTKERLHHEQGFFDIAEVNARRFRKLMTTMTIYKNTANKQIGTAYSQAIKDRAKEQGQYQKETEYGKNKVKQAEWDKKIKEQLKLLEKFAGQAVKVRMK
ncbi:MAG: hypothetical protein AB1458_03900 [Bacteroidota bacterium]